MIRGIIDWTGRVIVVRKRRFTAITVIALLLSSSLLAGCSSAEESTSMKADVILFDVSSGLNAAGTFNSEDHSVTSLSSRASQLRTKLARALEERTAVYFGYVRSNYGQQQIETLVSPKLIQLMDKTLNEDVKDPQLRKVSREGIVKAWNSILNSPKLANSENCSTQIANSIQSDSNQSITDFHASQLAGTLCSNAQSATTQIDGLLNTPDNIGSDIQSAIDRSIEKLTSDERRLFNSQNQQIFLIPTIILVSDMIQVTNGERIIKILANDAKISDSCQRAKDEAKNYSIKMDGIALVSDGFASVKGNINVELRDKLREYWKCWFETRGIYDPDFGTRGINIGEI
jgi:uncharacterized protein YcfL